MQESDSDHEPAKRRRGRPRNEVPSDEYVSKRDEIVTVASLVFRERGYDAGSLDDVAAAMDMRKASLYYYVKSKADLLRLVFDKAISRALAQMDEYAAIVEPAERLEALIRHQARTVASDPSLFGVFFDHRAGLMAEDLQELATKERVYVKHFIDAVSSAMTAGVIPPGDPRMIANTIIGCCSWVYKWFDPQRDDIEQVVRGCTDLLMGSRTRGK
jgi:AcrR family transcriptional regulator